MTKTHHPLIRTIYLYLFALLGLIFLTIGAIRFIDMGLKAFIFTQAEQEERLDYRQPPAFYQVERVKEIEQGGELTEDEKTAIRNWLADYEEWKEERDKVDPITSRRHRDASINLSMIIVGLPLYLYHWSVIKKDNKEKNTEENYA